MTGLAARGTPLFAARASIELTVLVIGWALGGSVGGGTVLFAAALARCWATPCLGSRSPRTVCGVRLTTFVD